MATVAAEGAADNSNLRIKLQSVLDDVYTELGIEAWNRETATDDLQRQINAQRGQGGGLPAYDFGVPSDQVTIEQWLQYAMPAIWPGIIP